MPHFPIDPRMRGAPPRSALARSRFLGQDPENAQAILARSFDDSFLPTTEEAFQLGGIDPRRRLARRQARQGRRFADVESLSGVGEGRFADERTEEFRIDQLLQAVPFEPPGGGGGGTVEPPDVTPPEPAPRGGTRRARQEIADPTAETAEGLPDVSAFQRFLQAERDRSDELRQAGRRIKGPDRANIDIRAAFGPEPGPAGSSASNNIAAFRAGIKPGQVNRTTPEEAGLVAMQDGLVDRGKQTLRDLAERVVREWKQADLLERRIDIGQALPGAETRLDAARARLKRTLEAAKNKFSGAFQMRTPSGKSAVTRAERGLAKRLATKLRMTERFGIPADEWLRANLSPAQMQQQLNGLRGVSDTDAWLRNQAILSGVDERFVDQQIDQEQAALSSSAQAAEDIAENLGVSSELARQVAQFMAQNAGG